MKQPRNPPIESCPDYQFFQEVLQDFERDLRRAWKIRASKSEMEDALSDETSDEILDMNFSREHLITSLVLLCQ